jgi:hypothetical protein
MADNEIALGREDPYDEIADHIGVLTPRIGLYASAILQPTYLISAG